jgi:4a-hydroxytetrahydrobiopterin dehydratase
LLQGSRDHPNEINFQWDRHIGCVQSTPEVTIKSRKNQTKEEKMPSLTAETIESRLRKLPGWRVEAGELVRTFEFADFRAALRFVNNVGELAELAGHHPDIDIRYNRVRLALTTHDAGGLTDKDFDLAGRIGKAA